MGVLTAAQEFQKLLDYEYEFIVVKNRNSEPLKLTLTFSKSDFFHLCGFQYLDDLRHLNTNTGVVFDEIINGNSQYSDSMFESSVYYPKIEDRVQLLEKLETLLDNRDKVNRSHRIFKFNRNANNNSRIEASFIVRDESYNLKNYFLIDKNNNQQYYGRSCFARTPNQRDYTAGHTAYTILYKGKVNLVTNNRDDLFIAPSYRTEFNAQQSVNNVIQIKFDNPLSDIQNDNTLAFPAPDSFRNAIRSLTERLGMFVQILQARYRKRLQRFSASHRTLIQYSMNQLRQMKMRKEIQMMTDTVLLWIMQVYRAMEIISQSFLQMNWISMYRLHTKQNRFRKIRRLSRKFRKKKHLLRNAERSRLNMMTCKLYNFWNGLSATLRPRLDFPDVVFPHMVFEVQLNTNI